MESKIPSRWPMLESAYYFAAISELAIPGSFRSTYSKHRLANGLPDVKCITPPLEVLQKFIEQSTPTPPLSPTLTIRPTSPTPPPSHQLPSPIFLQPTLEPDETTWTNDEVEPNPKISNQLPDTQECSHGSNAHPHPYEIKTRSTK